jgi:DNA processing protein
MDLIQYKYKFFGDRKKLENREFLGIYTSRSLTSYSLDVFSQLVSKFSDFFVFFLTYEAFIRLEGVKHLSNSLFCIIFEEKHWERRLKNPNILEVLLNNNESDGRLKYLLKDIFIVEKVSKLVVLEATRYSKNLEIISLYADQKGKKVFCIPGRIDSESSRGTNKLISEGVLPLYDLDLLKI